MTNRIPTSARTLVKRREKRRCLRCGGPGIQWCHRRRRNVADEHQHCPCNGWWGCLNCHNWSHQNPYLAMDDGFMVSAYTDYPGATPVESFYGLIRLLCDGGVDFVPTREPDEEEQQDA